MNLCDYVSQFWYPGHLILRTLCATGKKMRMYSNIIVRESGSVRKAEASWPQRGSRASRSRWRSCASRPRQRTRGPLGHRQRPRSPRGREAWSHASQSRWRSFASRLASVAAHDRRVPRGWPRSSWLPRASRPLSQLASRLRRCCGHDHRSSEETVTLTVWNSSIWGYWVIVRMAKQLCMSAQE